ncbi:MAG: YncE family protein [Rikenellaceae bacterium]|nr:YncE family protein [Rikenellaceae bacterium]
MRKLFAFAAAAALLFGCSESENTYTTESFQTDDHGLFIANEGNYMAGNASLSYYDPGTQSVENEVFLRANGHLLGDTAQSMTLFDGKLWICSNNSGVIFAIDPTTFKEVGRITLPGPRYVYFMSSTKGYVTQLWDNRIAIINPSTYTITGYIETGMNAAEASTEQLVKWGDYLFVNCWSYQKSILKIDTRTDEVVGSLEVGIQPESVMIDKNGKLWTMTDGGGWEGNPIGYEAPAIVRIDPESFSVEQRFELKKGDFPTELQLNATGDTLYWLNGGVWRMSVHATELPAEALLSSGLSSSYSLTLNPKNEDIYVGDAIDYAQNGMIFRYSATGDLLDSFGVGICPGTFCWK